MLHLDPNSRKDTAHGAMLVIFMYTGARPGEVYRLKTYDVALTRKAVAITLRDRKNKGCVIFVFGEKENFLGNLLWSGTVGSRMKDLLWSGTPDDEKKNLRAVKKGKKFIQPR